DGHVLVHEADHRFVIGPDEQTGTVEPVHPAIGEPGPAVQAGLDDLIVPAELREDVLLHLFPTVVAALGLREPDLFEPACEHADGQNCVFHAAMIHTLTDWVSAYIRREALLQPGR